MNHLHFLHEQARKCRTAAAGTPDARARQGLEQLAKHYDREARRLNLEEIKLRQA